MIVPRTRLLFWFSAVGIPLAGFAAVRPAAAIPLGIGLTLVAVDAVLSRKILAGIAVSSDPTIRLTAGREGRVDLTLLRSSRSTPARLRLLVPLPPELGGPLEPMPVQLPSDSDRARLSWPCRPTRRGRYSLDRVCLEGASPLGFWSVRSCVACRAELRVYPNLLGERRAVASIFLRRALPGIHSARQIGKGRDFEKLRDYVPGDSFDDIHWKATAKRAHPVTKVFQIERTQEIYAVLDASRLSGRPVAAGRGDDADTDALDGSVVAALMLALATQRQGDLFGLVAFTDRITHFLRARNGRVHFNACRDALFALQPQAVSPDFDEVAAFLRLRLRRRALLVFFTDLDDPVLAESFARNADTLARQHIVLVAMRRPRHAAPLFASGSAVSDIDDIYRHLAGHLSWQNLRELERGLRRHGVSLALLDDERLASGVVGRYLEIKQRQAL